MKKRSNTIHSRLEQVEAQNIALRSILRTFVALYSRNTPDWRDVLLTAEDISKLELGHICLLEDAAENSETIGRDFILNEFKAIYAKLNESDGSDGDKR